MLLYRGLTKSYRKSLVVVGPGHIISPTHGGPQLSETATTRSPRLLATMLECAVSSLAVVFSLVMSASAAEKRN